MKKNLQGKSDKRSEERNQGRIHDQEAVEGGWAGAVMLGNQNFAHFLFHYECHVSYRPTETDGLNY